MFICFSLSQVVSSFNQRVATCHRQAQGSARTYVRVFLYLLTLLLLPVGNNNQRRIECAYVWVDEAFVSLWELRFYFAQGWNAVFVFFFFFFFFFLDDYHSDAILNAPHYSDATAAATLQCDWTTDAAREDCQKLYSHTHTHGRPPWRKT